MQIALPRYWAHGIRISESQCLYLDSYPLFYILILPRASEKWDGMIKQSNQPTEI